MNILIKKKYMTKETIDMLVTARWKIELAASMVDNESEIYDGLVNCLVELDNILKEKTDAFL
jgi:hypothetical protein